MSPMPDCQPSDLRPTGDDLAEVFRAKYGAAAARSRVLRMWRSFGYYTPDEFYESLVAKLVRADSDWIDVGCGRDLFPYNQPLAAVLSRRCRLLVGLDPDGNVEGNGFVHRGVRHRIQDFRTEETFSLATLRMVVEHIADPGPALESLARLVKPGGHVVVYTVNRWSPLPLLAKATPFGLHHPFKALLWRTEERDTFPVAYQMNTRQRLRRLFESHGFHERFFQYVDDCRTFFRIPLLHLAELSLWRLCKRVGLPYPENCLLGVYRRE